MKNSEQKKILTATTEAKKTFSYELNGVTFNATLRIDVKKELVAMKEILVRAIEDFDKELLTIKSKE